MTRARPHWEEHFLCKSIPASIATSPQRGPATAAAAAVVVAADLEWNAATECLMQAGIMGLV